MKLYDFQRKDVAWLKNRSRSLLASEMGTGKTIVAIEVINQTLPDATLIVCPKSLMINWVNELNMWLRIPRDIQLIDNMKFNPLDAITIINYDKLARNKVLCAMHFDLLICDECHLLKSARAIRSHAAKRIQANRIIYMTGTPMLNRPMDLFSLLEVLDPQGLGRSFFTYAKRYCDAKQKTIFIKGPGAKRKTIWDFSGSSNLNELKKGLAPIMLRRTKEEVLPELPDKIRQVLVLPGKTSKEEVKFLEGNFDHTLEEMHAKCPPASKIAAARQETALEKLPYAVEHIKNSVESGPIVVFAHHVAVITELALQLNKDNYSPSIITGATDATLRQCMVDRFQNGETDIFIGSIYAAGVGITLTRSAHVIFIELDWVPSLIEQCSDRLHRIGQKNCVLIQYLVTKGSIDEYIAETLSAKSDVIRQVI